MQIKNLKYHSKSCILTFRDCEVLAMGIRHRLTDYERDDLTKDVDDLDAVYMEKLRKDGIDEDLLAQFRDLTLELEKDKEKNG